MTTTGGIAAKPTIHILGGGPSGLSAAFHLTSPEFNPGWRDRYHVVIHQMGWRLGGKGASGRNAEAGNRIEEHGIHLFGNMYANSLHMMYAAFHEPPAPGGPPRAPRDMEVEFEPSNFQLVNDFFGGRWHGFEGWLPYNDGRPWLIDSELGSASEIAQGALHTVKGIISATELPPSATESGWARVVSVVKVVVDVVRALARRRKVASGDEPLPVRLLEDAIAIFETILDDLEDELEAELRADPTGSARYDLLRWRFVQIDLVNACLTGAVNDNILTKGIDSIDDVPYRAWLERHGLRKTTRSSGLLQAIPNTCMQYPGGDTTRFPEMSAAAYLTFVLRQLVAPGDAAYFFRVSTGETVILPLYEVLIERGVQVEFFTKVTELVPSADGRTVERIDIRRQAHVAGPPGTRYHPLRTLPDGQVVWPNAPLYEQLVEGDELRDRGIDLESWWADWEGTPDSIPLGAGDLVVVALPPAAQAVVCRRAAEAAPDPGRRWLQMLDHVPTCATQALQIWLDKPTTALGWPDLQARDPQHRDTNRWLGPSFAGPLSAFADFSRALASETWPSQGAPSGLIYFCGALQDPPEIPPFTDHDHPAREKLRVGAAATQFLRELGSLLPNAADAANHLPDGEVPEPNSLDFSLLHCYHDPDTTHGEHRVLQQYYRANIDPNERYTVSAPGTLKHRPSPWESGCANVVLSSDAVFTGFNIGSFEGAVMSGKLAAYTITGSPSTDQIYGYGFCRPNPPTHPTPLLPS